MEEILAPTLKRIQLSELSKSLSDNKITLVKGPRFSDKNDCVIQSLETDQRTFETWNKKDFSQEKFETNWSNVISQVESEFLVIFEAEYLSVQQELIEFVLAHDTTPSLVLVYSFEPKIDPILVDVLKSEGALIAWNTYSFYELAQSKGMGSIEQELDKRLIYGSFFPDLDQVENIEEALHQKLEEILPTQISFEDRINKKEKLILVLKNLAFEMGEVISYNEIATRCDLDNETVERYIALFEKAFILKTIPSYYGGHKYEMKKGNSIYFLDNGLRNALINNFNSMDWRNDATQLWRNWLLIERMKWNTLLGKDNPLYTWRSHTKQSVDILEREGEQLLAYQASWTKKKKMRFPAGFQKNYPNALLFSLNRSTYWSFLSKKK